MQLLPNQYMIQLNQKRLCKEMPKQIFQLDHYALVAEAQRAFGGYSYARATYASDKVGFYEMQTLYDTCQKFENIEYLNEWFGNFDNT